MANGTTHVLCVHWQRQNGDLVIFVVVVFGFSFFLFFSLVVSFVFLCLCVSFVKLIFSGNLEYLEHASLYILSAFGHKWDFVSACEFNAIISFHFRRSVCQT